MLKGVIFGLDGTLSDPTHRAHLAQAGAWDDYRDAAPGDTPFPDVADLFRELQGTVPVWVVTGRDEAFRAPTEAWFLRHGRAHAPEMESDARPGTENVSDLGSLRRLGTDKSRGLLFR